MPIFLCYDPAKRTTPWTQEKHLSMVREFAKRRIKYFTVSCPAELERHLQRLQSETCSLVFFPASKQQEEYLFTRYANFDVHRIVFSHYDGMIISSNASSIVNDFYGNMKQAIAHLREKGCKKIALFGANPNFSHDRMRMESFQHLIREDEPLIFTSENGLCHCLQQLLQCEERLDAILCITDYIAFYLMRVLQRLDQDWNRKLLLLSFSDTELAALGTPSLSSFSLNFAAGGREVATIHRAFEKNDLMAYMHIVLKSRLSARETTATPNPCGIVFFKQETFGKEEIDALTEPQTHCMALEKLLAIADRIDLTILYGLIADRSLAEIAAELFLTREAIKYRVRKYGTQLQCENAQALAALLKLWIDPEKLKQYMQKSP